MFSNSNHAVVSGGVLNSIQGNLNYYTGNTPLPEEGPLSAFNPGVLS